MALVNKIIYVSSVNFFFFYCFERGGRGERRGERESCSTYLCIYLLILACALTVDLTCTLGVLGQWCNQVSYPARV